MAKMVIILNKWHDSRGHIGKWSLWVTVGYLRVYGTCRAISASPISAVCVWRSLSDIPREDNLRRRRISHQTLPTQFMNCSPNISARQHPVYCLTTRSSTESQEFLVIMSPPDHPARSSPDGTLPRLSSNVRAIEPAARPGADTSLPPAVFFAGALRMEAGGSQTASIPVHLSHGLMPETQAGSAAVEMVPVMPGFAAHAGSGDCLQGGMNASYDPPSSGIGLRAAEISLQHQSPLPFVSQNESTITRERNQQHTFSRRSTPELDADNILKLRQADLEKACVRVGPSLLTQSA
jgi:hypothetical protein